MLSCPDRSQDLTNPAFVGPTEASPAPTGFLRLAEHALHVIAVLSLGMLAAACAVIGLIWFSMGLPNG
jgi:hypothetical protein